MKLYRHKKRGTVYQRVCTLKLATVHPAVDEEVLVMLASQQGVLLLYRAAEIERNNHVVLQSLILQTENPCPLGTSLVCYRQHDTVDPSWYARPLLEFSDGRFESLAS